MIARIRTAKKKDIRLIPIIERAAATVFPQGRVPDQDGAHSLAELETFRKLGLFWVLELDCVPVCFAIASPIGQDMLLEEIDVLPQHARNGHGSRLLIHAITVAAQRGFSGVVLTTFADLPWNAPFYVKHGFSILKPHEYGKRLRMILDAERAAGMTRRVVMRHALSAASS